MEEGREGARDRARQREKKNNGNDLLQEISKNPHNRNIKHDGNQILEISEKGR